ADFFSSSNCWRSAWISVRSPVSVRAAGAAVTAAAQGNNKATSIENTDFFIIHLRLCFAIAQPDFRLAFAAEDAQGESGFAHRQLAEFRRSQVIADRLVECHAYLFQSVACKRPGQLREFLATCRLAAQAVADQQMRRLAARALGSDGTPISRGDRERILGAADFSIHVAGSILEPQTPGMIGTAPGIIRSHHEPGWTKVSTRMPAVPGRRSPVAADSNACRSICAAVAGAAPRRHLLAEFGQLAQQGFDVHLVFHVDVVV